MVRVRSSLLLRELDKVVGVVAGVNLSRAVVGHYRMAGHVRDLAEENVSRPRSKRILPPGTTRQPGEIELHQTQLARNSGHKGVIAERRCAVARRQ